MSKGNDSSKSSAFNQLEDREPYLARTLKRSRGNNAADDDATTEFRKKKIRNKYLNRAEPVANPFSDSGIWSQHHPADTAPTDIEFEDTKNREAFLKQLFSKHTEYTDVCPQDFRDACRLFGERSRMIRPYRDEHVEGWILKGMKSPLLHHQLLGVAKMREFEIREDQRGGFQADAMGLGKTVMMLANILGGRWHDEALARLAPSNGKKRTIRVRKPTLILVPSKGLLHQWMSEIDKHCEDRAIGRVMPYTRSAKEQFPKMLKQLAKCDVVLATYAEAVASFNKGKASGPLHKFGGWSRVVLDEGHRIKNKNNITAKAVGALNATFRWCMSGTPFINDALSETYSYLHYLQLTDCHSFKDFNERYAGEEGRAELQEYLQTLMIRRTMKTTLFGEPIIKIPPPKCGTIHVDLIGPEREFYDLLEKQAGKWIKALKEREEDIEQLPSHVLYVLNMLRQYTSHFLLCSHLLPLQDPDGEKIKSLLALANRGNFPPKVDRTFHTIQKIKNAAMKKTQKALHANAEDDDIKSVHRKMLRGLPLLSRRLEEAPKKKPFRKPRLSKRAAKKPKDRSRYSVAHHFKKAGDLLLSGSKTTKIVEKVQYWLEQDREEKIVIFSQFVQTLDILSVLLEQKGVNCQKYNGKMSSQARREALENWQEDAHIPILLMSFSAGSEGLNLTQASRAIIVDPWYNSAREDQAFSRLYRIGQRKATELIRFVANGTIEEFILEMQVEKKNGIASVMGADGQTNEARGQDGTMGKAAKQHSKKTTSKKRPVSNEWIDDDSDTESEDCDQSGSDVDGEESTDEEGEDTSDDSDEDEDEVDGQGPSSATARAATAEPKPSPELPEHDASDGEEEDDEDNDKDSDKEVDGVSEASADLPEFGGQKVFIKREIEIKIEVKNEEDVSTVATCGDSTTKIKKERGSNGGRIKTERGTADEDIVWDHIEPVGEGLVESAASESLPRRNKVEDDVPDGSAWENITHETVKDWF